MCLTGRECSWVTTNHKKRRAQEETELKEKKV